MLQLDDELEAAMVGSLKQYNFSVLADNGNQPQDTFTLDWDTLMKRVENLRLDFL